RKKLGQILVGWGVLNAAQAEKATEEAKKSGKRIGQALVDLGMASEEQVAKGLAEQFGMQYVDLAKGGVAEQIDRKALDEGMMKRDLVLPMGKSGGKMRLVIHDPMDLELLDNLRFRLNADIEPLIASRGQIRGFIEGTLDGGGGAAAAKPIAAGGSLVTDS